MSEERISSSELFTLVFGFIIGSTIVLPIAPMAKKDSWLAEGLAVIGGTLLALIYTSLARRYPGKSLVQYAPLSLGRYVGKAFGVLYIWYALHLGALVLRNFGELITLVLLPGTPPVVVYGVMIFMIALAVRQGVEVLGRTSQFLFIIIVFNIIIITVLIIPRASLDNLRPMLGEGWLPVLKGAWEELAFPYGETVLFAMVLPHLNRPHQARSTFLKALVTGGVLLGIATARNWAVLGNLTSSLIFPSFEVSRMISIADFIDRVEALVLVTWISVGFIKIGVCYYAATTGLAQWLGLQDYRPLVYPIGIIMAALSLLVYANVHEMLDFAARIWPPYSLPFQIVIPLIMLFAATWRRAGGKAPANY